MGSSRRTRTPGSPVRPGPGRGAATGLAPRPAGPLGPPGHRRGHLDHLVLGARRERESGPGHADDERDGQHGGDGRDRDPLRLRPEAARRARHRQRRGHAVPGTRVDDPGQPGHRHRPPGRQPADDHRRQGKHQEIGDEPLSRTERRQGPPPSARGGPVAEQQGEQDQRRQRPEERPGERQQGHPERQRDQRRHQQSRTEGEDGAGAEQDRGPRAGPAPGPGQPGQGRIENTAGHHHTARARTKRGQVPPKPNSHLRS